MQASSKSLNFIDANNIQYKVYIYGIALWHLLPVVHSHLTRVSTRKFFLHLTKFMKQNWIIICNKALCHCANLLAGLLVFHET